MSYEAPVIRWGVLRTDAADGRPAVEVPAELGALGVRERALLEARLAWRCGTPDVRVGPGGRPAIAFVEIAPDRVTAAFRAAADAAVASVAADAAAGWTAADERERHGRFSWDDPGTIRRRTATSVHGSPAGITVDLRVSAAGRGVAGRAARTTGPPPARDEAPGALGPSPVATPMPTADDGAVPRRGAA